SSSRNAYLTARRKRFTVASAENAQSNVRENIASTKLPSCVSSRRACPQPAPQQEPFSGNQQPPSPWQWVFDRSYPVAIAPGSRVTLHNLPSYLAAFEETDAYVLDYPLRHGVHVRTSVRDAIVINTNTLRRCPVVGEGQIKLYDRVETTHDILPYRSGRIEQLIDDDDGEPLVTVRDARDGSILHLRMRDTQKQFIPGDTVRVVGGFYAGCRAIVKKTVSLATQFGGEATSIGAFELRCMALTNGNRQTMEKTRNTSRVTRQHIDFLPAQAATAPPTGPAHHSVEQTWLCSPQLVLKRIDVRVVPPKRRDNCNNILASSVGKTGFIELESALTPQQLRLRLDVHMDDGTRRVGIPVNQLQPVDVHYVPMDSQLPRLAHAAPRVIVIGPDLYGSFEDVGKYGMILVDDTHSMPGIIRIRFERASKDPNPARVNFFPHLSICRSLNLDGKKTVATRFY
ncbi:hypothetical protein C8F01DRAFT_1154790, partial [Mycena amicta]